MLRRLVLALLVALLPLRALAATCTLPTGTYNWTAACTVSAGSITGCSCAAGNADVWEIPEGANATIPNDGISNDLDVSMSAAGASIVVRKNGSLTLAPAGGLGIPGGGLLVETGGTLIGAGRALRVGTAGPTFVEAILSPATQLQAGNVVPCPAAGVTGREEDCEANNVNASCSGAGAPWVCCTGVGTGTCVAGSAQESAICWPDANAGTRTAGYAKVGAGHPGETFNTENIAALVAGDLISFWDPSGGLTPPRDVNTFYEITSTVTGVTNQCAVFNVRQGTTETSCHASRLSCHLVERDILEVTLSAAYTKGQTTLLVGTTAITADAQRMDRFLDCPADIDGDGTNENVRQLVAITEIDDSATDLIRLMPGGFNYNIATASTCQLTRGWEAGDPLSFIRPALFGDGNSGVIDDSRIVCSRGATCSFDFSLFNHLGTAQFWESTVIRNSWWREGGNGLGNMQMNVISSQQTWSRFQMTSPNIAAAHMISIDGPNSSPTFEDLTIRHGGDDHILFNDCTATPPSTCTSASDITSRPYRATIRRMRAEGMGCAGTTCSMFDDNDLVSGQGARQVVIDATDVLAWDAEGGTVDTSPWLHGTQATGAISLKNAVNIAGPGSRLATIDSPSVVEISLVNYYEIGRRSQLSGGVDVPAYDFSGLTDSSILDTSMNNGSSPFMRTPFQTTAAGAQISMVRTLWRGINGGNNNIVMFDLDDAPNGGLVKLEDVAIIAPTGIQAQDILSIGGVNGDTGSMTLNRVTFAMLPGMGGVSRLNALQWSGDDTVFATLRKATGILFANWWVTTGGTVAFDTNTTDAAPSLAGRFCFDNNDVDLTTGTDIPAGALRDDRNSAYVNELLGDYTPQRSSKYVTQCGAVNPGASDMWALRVLHHDPYRWGDTWKTRAYGLR
jgi:hypothetical protein